MARERSRSRSPVRVVRPPRPMASFVEVRAGGLDAKLEIRNFPNMFSTSAPLLVLLGESMQGQNINVVDYKLRPRHLIIKFQHPEEPTEPLLEYYFSMGGGPAYDYVITLEVQETSGVGLFPRRGYQGAHRAEVRRIIYKFVNKIGASASRRAMGLVRNVLVRGEIPEAEDKIARF